ncbi:MAG: GDP-mannose 4,6-dehydratase [Candidatus Levybacteria bacterium]|nr:GDP-mannose 4,6-dehydratase [Candidatus Levybacteria bacterium]
MKILITGGAGFIGMHLADYFLSKRKHVTILDNFSRKGVTYNAAYLSKKYPRITIVKTDVRDFATVKRKVKKHDVVIHLAGQVAVTTSIANPRADFENNVIGTFNILEAARLAGHKPAVLYASTNKVYGKLRGKIVKKGKRYSNLAFPNGVSETEPLDFYSPYGCSKGAADQYMHDYARIYGIPTVVLRQSCIYGTRQLGVEDQGWLAHFLIQSMFEKLLTIYGTGYQVRDVLYIDDLVFLYDKVLQNIYRVGGEVFNVGGGNARSLSLLELIVLLEKMMKKKINISFAPKRPGDQDVYVSDTSKAKKILNWKPLTPCKTGILMMYEWAKANKDLLLEFT